MVPDRGSATTRYGYVVRTLANDRHKRGDGNVRSSQYALHLRTAPLEALTSHATQNQGCDYDPKHVVRCMAAWDATMQRCDMGALFGLAREKLSHSSKQSHHGTAQMYSESHPSSLSLAHAEGNREIGVYWPCSPVQDLALCH